MCPRNGTPLIHDRDGLLYRRIVRPSDNAAGYLETDVLIAPASLHATLIAAFHDHAGHGSTTRTLALLRS